MHGQILLKEVDAGGTMTTNKHHEPRLPHQVQEYEEFTTIHNLLVLTRSHAKVKSKSGGWRGKDSEFLGG